MSTIEGSCLCGTVKYQAANFDKKMAHCHCSMCRKFHGAAFATFAVVAKDQFVWISGQSNLASYTADNGTVRQFCKTCGASLTFACSSEPSDVVEIAMGSLDTQIEQRPDAHIYVDSKAQWYDIQDSLTQYSAGRASKVVK